MKNTIANLFARFRRDERGVTLVEYGIALVLAVVVGSVALTALGGEVSTSMNAAAAVM